MKITTLIITSLALCAISVDVFAADEDLNLLSCDLLEIEMEIAQADIDIGAQEIEQIQRASNAQQSSSSAMNAFNQSYNATRGRKLQENRRKQFDRLASLKRAYATRPCSNPRLIPQPAGVSQIVNQWAQQSTWFNKDSLLTKLAIDEMGRLQQRYPGVSDEYFLPLIDAYITSLPSP